MALYNLRTLYNDGQVPDLEAGLKVMDMVAAEKDLSDVGLHLVDGEVIGGSYFDCFMKANNLTPDDQSTRAHLTDCPPELLALNQKLNASFRPGWPVAVRSSAIGERGGTGIYESAFYIPEHGDRTENGLFQMWENEKKVYKSEFSANAKAYRKQSGAPMGMAILLQPVVSRKIGSYFSPILSGTAYSCYQGKPLIRFTSGLGTKAVIGDAAVIHGEFPSEEEFWNLIESTGGYHLLYEYDAQIQVFNPRDPQGMDYRVNDQIMERIDRGPIWQLWKALQKLQAAGQSYYLEWAWDGEDDLTPKVVQAAPYIDKPILPIEVNFEDKVLLAQGTDVVNHGVKQTETIVWAGQTGWTASNLDYLEQINDQLRNYILVVPQTAFSLATTINSMIGSDRVDRLGFSHFSRAAGIIELQWRVDELERKLKHQAGYGVADHSDNRGGKHFQSLCTRRDILFLGTLDDLSALNKFRPTNVFGREVYVYEVPAVLINDVTAGQGRLYLGGEVRQVPYSSEAIRRYADTLYEVASELNGSRNKTEKELSGSFYYCCYVLPSAINPVGFDPFEWDRDGVDTLEQGINAVETVLRQGGNFVGHNWGGMEEYLRDLLEHMKKEL